ncbi:S1 family peptidase [Rhizobium laguerreae]|uniref:S1 family peptidase n=1 Tax=Rhizobium laguerreae TaxID=1076926 RepID=UPI003008C723
MTLLIETVEEVRSGVFNLQCLSDGNFQKLGSGSAFFSSGYLVTNFHVADIPEGTWMWVRRDGDCDHRFNGFVVPAKDWRKALKRASEEHSYDYAILDLPTLRNRDDIHDFVLGPSQPAKIGTPIAFLGFPLDHDNLVCHSGHISSFRKSGVARIIQIDASVNAANSGGPLIEPDTGRVIGTVSRKATGLSKVLDELKKSIALNVRQLETSRQGIAVKVAGIDPTEVAIATQNQLAATLGEIERQANVGIGYAIDAEHLIQDWPD